MKIYKIIKEMGIALMFIVSIAISYGHWREKKEVQEVTIKSELMKLNKVNENILKKVDAIAKDYNKLKIKLLKSGIITEFGGFVDMYDDEKNKHKKPTRRACNTDMFVSKKGGDDDGFFLFFDN